MRFALAVMNACISLSRAIAIMVILCTKKKIMVPVSKLYKKVKNVGAKKG